VSLPLSTTKTMAASAGFITIKRSHFNERHEY
jgi:hypothetical protein